jgi:hypothetical protein
MNCLHEGCEKEAVDDGNYCVGHQWSQTLEGVIEEDRPRYGTKVDIRGGGPDKSKSVENPSRDPDELREGV